MRVIALAACLLGLTGCLFDGAVPAGAAISCELDTDCPGDDVCVVGRCAPVEALRADTPTPADVVITPAVVGRAGSVDVTFTVAASLGAPPVVDLDAGRPLPFTLVSGTPGAPWHFQRTLDGGEAPGPAAVSITLVDELGRETVSAAGEVLIDLSPPAFSEAQLVTATARAGSTIGADALLDAPADVVAEAVLADGTVVSLDVVVEGLRVRARGLIDGRYGSGPVTVRLAARDAGGNESGPVDVGEVDVDLDAPVVTIQPLPTTVRPRDLVRIIATASEPVVAPTLTVAGAPLLADVAVGTTLSWSWIVPDDDGNLTLAPGDFADLAGNTTTLAPFAIAVDGTAPVLTIIEPPTAKARAGEQVVATFGFDEPVTGVVVEAQRFDDVVDVPVVDDGGVWRIDVASDRFASEGRYDLIVSARDEVGNETRALLGAVVVDARPPTLLSAAFTPDAGRLGSIVTLQLTLSEPPRVTNNVVDVDVVINAQGLTFVGLVGTTVTYTFVVQDDTPAVVELEQLRVTDVAGNVAVIDAGNTARLVVDNLAPVLTGVLPTARRVARRNGEEIVVTGTATDDGGTPPQVIAAFAGRLSSCVLPEPTRFKCEVPVVVSDEDGPQSVEIVASDAAGNVTTATVVVTLDGEGPLVVSAEFSAARARPGSGVQLVVVADERVAAMTLGLSTGNLDLLPNAASVGRTVTMPAVDLKLNSIRLEDELGNARNVILDAAPVVVADGAPPDITGSVVSSNRIPLAGRAGDAVVVDVDVDLPLIEDPTINFGGAPMEIIGDDGAGHFTARHLLTGSETEGATVVTVTAVDDVGNVGFAALATPVVVDFTAPSVVADSVQVGVRPPPGSPVLDSKAVGLNGAATVSFQVGERLFGLPAIRVDGLPVPVGGLSVFGTSVTVQVGVGALKNGTQLLQAVLEDQVGNVRTADVTELLADLVPPPPLSPAERALFTHVRAPHGSIQVPTAFHEVRARSVLAARTGHTLTVALDALETLRVATAEVAAGEPPVIALDRDFDSVFLQIYDEAGNRALSSATRPRTEFIAGLNGKIAGSLASNPHRIELRRHFTNVTVDASAEELDGELVALLDGTSLSVEPAGRWQESGPQPPPTARSRVASATHDDTVYLFGGCTAGGEPSDEAWFFDGRGWKAFTGQDGPSPPARCGAGLVSDGGRLHLVGGEGTTGLLDDHWVWDGLNWRQEPETTRLPASDMALGYSPPSDELVHYGGFTGSGVSGQHLRAPAAGGGAWQVVGNGPAVAAGAGVSLGNGTLLVIGGVDGRGNIVTSVLAVEQNGVTQASSLPGPLARACAVRRTDDDVLVLGGIDDRTAVATAFVVRPGRVDPEPELQLPGPRFSAGCGLVAEKPLIFGGAVDNGALFDDALRFEADWRPIEAAADLPSARSHAAATTTIDEITYTFGGATSGGASDEVWELKEVWKRVGKIDVPVERAASACVANECYVVGGLDTQGSRVVDGQRWRRSDGEVRVVFHAGLTPRANPALAPLGEGLVLFGGVTQTGLSGETCVAAKGASVGDGIALDWTCSILPGPPASPGAVMVSLKAQVFLYAAGQIWLFKGDHWSPSSAAARPPTRQFPGLVADNAGDRIFLHGGVVGTGRLADLWVFEPERDTWQEQAAADPFGVGAPDPRSAHVARFDPGLRRVVVFGGEDQSTRFNDMWDFLSGDEARAGVVFSVDTRSLGGFTAMFIQAIGRGLAIDALGAFGDAPSGTLPLLGDAGLAEVAVTGGRNLVLDAVDIRLIRP